MNAQRRQRYEPRQTMYTSIGVLQVERLEMKEHHDGDMKRESCIDSALRRQCASLVKLILRGYGIYTLDGHEMPVESTRTILGDRAQGSR